MNERMKELARQAGFGPTANPYERKVFDVNMFAELIVRECGQVSLQSSHRDDDMGAIIARNINKHFGVQQ